MCPDKVRGEMKDDLGRGRRDNRFHSGDCAVMMVRVNSGRAEPHHRRIAHGPAHECMDLGAISHEPPRQRATNESGGSGDQDA